MSHTDSKPTPILTPEQRAELLRKMREANARCNQLAQRMLERIK